jgi:hypothetical protein
MIEAGANPKDVQGQMRHSRISTTMDIYAQNVPESQNRAVARMMEMVESRRVRENVTLTSQNLAVLDDVVIKQTELSN